VCQLQARAFQAVHINTETVILCGNIYSTGFQVFYWVIDAPVPEFELVSLPPKGQSEDLLTKADAENGHLP